MTNVFQHHERDFRDNRYVYPVVSRRSRGISIGVDLTHERCTFRCIYCSELARREGSIVTQEELLQSEDRSCRLASEIDLDVLEDELRHMVRFIACGKLMELEKFRDTPPGFRRLNDIALSGSGEPTLSPSFDDVCRLIRKVGDWAREDGLWRCPKAVLITNATALHLQRVKSGLAHLDGMGEIWAKLDAGTQSHYLQMNRSLVPFERVLDNLLEASRRESAFFIQTLFGVLDGQPPSEEEIGAWMGRLSWLKSQGARIREVQIYTVARAPRGGPIQPLADGDLAAIAQRTFGTTGIPASWFGSAGNMGSFA